MLATSQGSPSPKKTLTELLPLILPIALSAFRSRIAAIRLANKSGSDVPMDTNVMAVTISFNPIKQPNIEARSPIRALITAIVSREKVNASQPPHRPMGGTTIAKNIYK